MASVSQTASSSSGVNGTSFTFSALSVGARVAGDVLYVLVGSRCDSSAPSATVTIDGVSAGLAIQNAWNEAGNIYSYAGIFSLKRSALPDPTQTDVDVVVSFGATTMLRCGVGLGKSSDASDTASVTKANDPTIAGNLNANVSAGDVVVGVVFQGAADTMTWTGLTEATDTVIESGTFSTAYESNVSAATPRSMDVVPDVTSDLSSAVVAVFPPAPATKKRVFHLHRQKRAA